MRKAKQYDWKDSNLALFGSDVEKKVKKESASTEKCWQGTGQAPGLRVWRIVKFKVTDWPKEDYGEFYSGDSYIVLNTYKEPATDELLMDVHFWIGKYSTQDEYGTAAYKTVELDTYLNDKPVQHREVMGSESHLFKSYFSQITILKGGAETGFRRVVPKQPKIRLLHFKGTTLKNIQVKEVAAKRGNLNNEDVFIIDTFYELWQYNGAECDKDERFKAAQWMQKLRNDRYGKVKKTGIIEGEDVMETHHAVQLLADGTSKNKAAPKVGAERRLNRLSDAGGKMTFEEVASGKAITRDKFQSADVFIFDRGDHCFVWIGKEASVDERRNSLSYGSNYLNKTDHSFVPLTVITEGQKNKDFNGSF